MDRLCCAGLALTGAILVQACSSAPHRIKSEDVSNNWNGQKSNNVLVIGVYEDRPYRASAETAFAEELKNQGIAAEPSFDIIPDLASLDSEEDIARSLSGRNNDAILSVATIDPGYDFDYEDALETRGMVVLLGGRPGPYTDLGNFIAWAGSGGYTLHVGLWDPVTQRPLWQATTSSRTTGSESGDTKALAQFVRSTLQEKGML